MRVQEIMQFFSIWGFSNAIAKPWAGPPTSIAKHKLVDHMADATIGTTMLSEV